MDLLLGPLDIALPFYAVVLILAVVTGLYSAIAQKTFADYEALSAYHERARSMQNGLKRAEDRGDDVAVERIQEEQMNAMGDQLGTMKTQLRPTVWIVICTVLIFLWLYWKLLNGCIGPGETQLIVPLAGAVGWQEALIGPVKVWIVWYFICSVSFGQLIRKTLNVGASA